MSRITIAFETLKNQNKTALIPFVMCGDGNTPKILDALVSGGADIIELGIPFSDPMADGATIQASGLRALEAGMTLEKTIATAGEFRKQHIDVPIVLMGYYNPIFHMGAEKFCILTSAAGIDGIIVVDLPPEEEDELALPLKKHGINLVRLIAPTSLEKRLPMLVKNASGYIYYIAVAGITGAKGASADNIKTAVDKIKAETKLPIAVGFGIKTAPDAAKLKDIANGVVIGSALIEAMQKDPKNAADIAKTMMIEIKKALS